MKILVTGDLGQIGSELSIALKKIYGEKNVITSDLHSSNIKDEFQPYETLNILDKQALANVIKKHEITTIYHLAAILSATGEKNPQLCFDVNIIGLYNVLEVARELKIKQIIWCVCVRHRIRLGSINHSSKRTSFSIPKLTRHIKSCDVNIFS